MFANTLHISYKLSYLFKHFFSIPQDSDMKETEVRENSIYKGSICFLFFEYEKHKIYFDYFCFISELW